MQQIMANILTFTVMIFVIFQPLILHNSSQTKETIKISVYEVQKEAAKIGHLNDDLKAEFKNMLVQNHGYNPECIQIEGTSEIVSRGGDIEISVTVPKPIQNVFDAIDFASCSRPDSYTPYVVTQVIKSEYIP